MRLKTKKQKLEAFRQKCRDGRLNMTPQRRAIYEILVESEDHPRTEDVFERVRRDFPDIAIDTVYRTLATFSEMGLIHVVEGYGEARRYDPDVESHHHFRCRRCGRIIDFRNETFDHLEIPADIRSQCSVTGIKVVLEGLCSQCMESRK